MLDSFYLIISFDLILRKKFDWAILENLLECLRYKFLIIVICVLIIRCYIVKKKCSWSLIPLKVFGRRNYWCVLGLKLRGVWPWSTFFIIPWYTRDLVSHLFNQLFGCNWLQSWTSSFPFPIIYTFVPNRFYTLCLLNNIFGTCS